MSGQRGVTVAVGRGRRHGVQDVLAVGLGARARLIGAVHRGSEDGWQGVHVRIVLGGGQPYAYDAYDDHQYGDEHHDTGHDANDQRVVVGNGCSCGLVGCLGDGRRLLLLVWWTGGGRWQ